MSEGLKICPFCGGEAEIKHWDAAPFWHVTCTKCGCDTRDFNNECDAILTWNKRCKESD